MTFKIGPKKTFSIDNDNGPANSYANVFANLMDLGVIDISSRSPELAPQDYHLGNYLVTEILFRGKELSYFLQGINNLEQSWSLSLRRDYSKNILSFKIPYFQFLYQVFQPRSNIYIYVLYSGFSSYFHVVENIFTRKDVEDFYKQMTKIFFKMTN